MGTSPHPALPAARAPAAAARLRREADLRSEGLRIFTTLDPRAQGAAERVLARRLAQFDKEKRFGPPGARRRGRGHRQPDAARCRRWSAGATRATAASTARSTPRGPVGSLLKPAIYLTALAEPSRYTLVTPIDDGPFVWKSRGAPGLGAGELRQEVPRHGAAAHRARAVLQRRRRRAWAPSSASSRCSPT